MRRSYRLLAIAVLIAAVLLAFLLYSLRVVRSQSAMPGTYPLKNETSAISVAQTVATFNSTEETGRLILASVKRIGSKDFEGLLASSEMYVEPSTLLGAPSASEDSTVLDGNIWIVSFTGSFSPTRVPPGVVPPVYSKIDVFLDASDGSVIGLQMHD